MSNTNSNTVPDNLKKLEALYERLERDPNLEKAFLEDIQNEYQDISIGSYPYFRPPDVGTNIILRSINLNLITRAAIAICKKLEETNINFEEI